MPPSRRRKIVHKRPHDLVQICQNYDLPSQPFQIPAITTKHKPLDWPLTAAEAQAAKDLDLQPLTTHRLAMPPLLSGQEAP